MFIIAIIFHYPQYLLLPPVFSLLGLTRHAMERILFLLPMTYTGFIFGIKAGLASTVMALIIMLPRIFLISPSPRDALLETCGVIVIGGLINLWFEGYRRERERSQQALLRLDAAQKELQSYIQLIRSNEKRLTALNEVSDVVTQSLELQDVLNAATEKVMEVMEADNTLAFLLDEEGQVLELKAYQGVSEEFAAGVGGLKVGEGFNGRVAQTGEPLVIEDASSDPKLTREVVKRESIQAVLIVALKAKGKVVGTLCVATLAPRQFTSKDIDLLVHIANHIGVSVENARLYQRERVMTEQIAKDAATEKQMRENLSFYLQQVTRAQEDERLRISRELHDDTAQVLADLSRGLASLNVRGTQLPKAIAERLEKLHGIADSALEGIRRFSQDLRPSILDDLGLVPALEWLVANLEKQSEITTRISVTGNRYRLPPEKELIVFRIAQETLSNVRRHSKASAIEMTIDYGDDALTLIISDNGQGFHMPARASDLIQSGKLGIIGMRERARLVGGTLIVQSDVNVGTTVTLRAPA